MFCGQRSWEGCVAQRRGGGHEQAVTSAFKTACRLAWMCVSVMLLIIIMYIYHALINALSAHMIHINLNMIFYTYVEHSTIKTNYINYYSKK